MLESLSSCGVAGLKRARASNNKSTWYFCSESVIFGFNQSLGTFVFSFVFDLLLLDFGIL